MKPDELEVKNKYRETTFHHAAASGYIEIVKAMRERNNNLLNIPIGDGRQLPITLAAFVWA